MSFKTASTVPYARTVYAIRHKPTNLLVTNSYWSSDGWEAQYSFSSLPELWPSPNRIPEMGEDYETVELDLIELGKQDL